MSLDLFGEPIEPSRAAAKRKGTRANGYGGTPGTGPAGETCKTCRFHVVKSMGKNYHKCLKARLAWTCGPGSDIRLRSPACWLWKPKEDSDD